MSVRKMLAAALTIALGSSAASAVAAQQAPTPAATPAPRPAPVPCRDIPERRQFDFWIGSWDVHPWAAPGASGPRLGTNVIEATLDHCVLVENWTGARGGNGKSQNWYDRNLGNWRQLWIDSNGGTLDYTRGEFRDGAMRFMGYTRNPQGQRVEQRLTFFRLHPDTVRQLFETSTDSGRTWTPGFDGRYIRRAGAASGTGGTAW